MKNSFKTLYLYSTGLAKFTFGIHYLLELLECFNNKDSTYSQVLINVIDDIERKQVFIYLTLSY